MDLSNIDYDLDLDAYLTSSSNTTRSMPLPTVLRPCDISSYASMLGDI